MTTEQVLNVIAVLSDCYPSARFSEDAYKSWEMVLDGYTDDEVVGILPSVMKSYLHNCPPPSAIAKAIDDARTPPLNAQEAWDAVHSAIRSCGSSNTKCLRAHISEEQIWKAAETIGWGRLGLTPFEQHGTLFAQFKGVLNDTIATHENSERRVMIEDWQPTGLGSGDA